MQRNGAPPKTTTTMSATTAATAATPLTNQYGEVLTLNPALLATVQQIPGITVRLLGDLLLTDLIKATHHGALTNASSYLEADVRSQQWKTIRTWLAAGSMVSYYYGEQLDVLLVDHRHGKGGQAYKGYSMLSA
jgi:hypothetical protein